ncbi:TIGR02117 family protein [Variovorax sp. J22R133]|uniref:TIGR02117 family protein n=1 Tax=Variovorax brevis TaxID=3053503 RepID=UPI002578030B|nr:TIGR02117 family protein [Variovorax sp. J22R133]MDM0114240.1 TIGR02117 family protein [Variovorax sp. J22R133]
MRALLRTLALLLMVPVAALLAYLGVACALMFFPANMMATTEARSIEAWVLSNGVHTDLVLPVRGHGIDWSQLFLPAHFRAAPPDAEYVAIGWGDREFYLHTPRWADLTASRAFGAVMGVNPALLHVTYLKRDELAAFAHRLPLSQRQHQLLVDYVRAALPGGRALPVADAHYGSADAFYEAQGSYDLFDTCNAWTGRGLREAGVVMGWWTPFDFNVLWHVQ